MCIALDLDGTTLDDKGQLTEETRKAIEYAIAEGAHILIASGRSFRSLPEQVVNIPGIEYAITSNGAALYHVPTGEKIHGYKLSAQAVDKILNLMKDEEIVFEAFIDGHAYADSAYVNDPVRYGASPQAVEYVKRTRQFVDHMETFIREHIEELDSIDIVVSTLELKAHIMEVLQSVEGEVYVTSSVDQLVEISDKNAGKASGLRYITEYLNIPRAQTAAFGNADNDIDMIEFAAYGYAVANASEGCRKAADYIVNSNAEGGVVQGIYDFLEKVQNR